MQTYVENLVQVELGSLFVAEADFQEYRISVKCIHDAVQRSWLSDVYLLHENASERLTALPSPLHSDSRNDAVSKGMQFAVDRILNTG